MNKALPLLAASVLLSALASCASIIDGTKQSVNLKTTPSGAACRLSNDKGAWNVPATPADITVHRAYGDLTVDCTKKDSAGDYTGLTNVESKTKGWAYGNIIFGGIIGIVIDVANGSAYDYPRAISVPLQAGEAKTAVSATVTR